jgi:uncharacterized protein DUF4158
MKQDWTIDEIIEHFTLLEDEQEFIGVNAPHNKLGKALLLKFFQHEFRFPDDQSEIPRQAVEYIAQQLDLSPNRGNLRIRVKNTNSDGLYSQAMPSTSRCKSCCVAITSVLSLIFDKGCEIV